MAKKTRKKKAVTAPVQLQVASRTKRVAVVRDLNKVLAAHGVRGKVSELRLSGLGAATTAIGCPPGQVKQVVCRKQPDGSVVCKEECV